MNGGPLRHYLDASFLASAESYSHIYLYEAQISFVVTGTDESRWEAHCFVDTYFDEGDPRRETVAEYHKDREFEGGINADPLTYGHLDAEAPIRDPRKYFLMVFEIRLSQVRREWEHVVMSLKEKLALWSRDDVSLTITSPFLV